MSAWRPHGSTRAAVGELRYVLEQSCNSLRGRSRPDDYQLSKDEQPELGPHGKAFPTAIPAWPGMRPTPLGLVAHCSDNVLARLLINAT